MKKLTQAVPAIAIFVQPSVLHLLRSTFFKCHSSVSKIVVSCQAQRMLQHCCKFVNSCEFPASSNGQQNSLMICRVFPWRERGAESML